MAAATAATWSSSSPQAANERIRFAALRELAFAESDLDAGLARLAAGTGSASRFVAAMSAHEIAKVEATRSWIER